MEKQLKNEKNNRVADKLKWFIWCIRMHFGNGAQENRSPNNEHIVFGQCMKGVKLCVNTTIIKNCAK